MELWCSRVFWSFSCTSFQSCVRSGFGNLRAYSIDTQSLDHRGGLRLAVVLFYFRGESRLRNWMWFMYVTALRLMCVCSVFSLFCSDFCLFFFLLFLIWFWSDFLSSIALLFLCAWFWCAHHALCILCCPALALCLICIRPACVIMCSALDLRLLRLLCIFWVVTEGLHQPLNNFLLLLIVGNSAAMPCSDFPTENRIRTAVWVWLMIASPSFLRIPHFTLRYTARCTRCVCMSDAFVISLQKKR